MAKESNIAPAAFLAAVAPEVVATSVNAVTKGGPRRQYKWNKRAAEDANAMNRANAEWTLEQNRRLLEEQRVYDSPQAQMDRYKAAGLNPNLIYGSAGQSSSPIQVGGLAPSRLDAPDASYPDLVSPFIAAGQAQSQMSLRSAQTKESYVRQQASALQQEIARTNPMLRPEVAASVADALDQVSQLKADTAYFTNQIPEGGSISRGRQKVQAELDGMFQRLGLNTADLQIKNKILESKEFENAVKEVQASWLKDADVTPEHIRQGLMLILGKMLP